MEALSKDNREFELAMHRLEQALFKKLSYGVYKYHDIEYILGEVRKMWDA